MHCNRGIPVLVLAAAGLCAAQNHTSISPYPPANFTTILGPWDGPGIETRPTFINDNGDILGYYRGPDNVSHGFVLLHDCAREDGRAEEDRTDRRECGRAFTLDAPNAGTEELEGTILLGADKDGVILGTWADNTGERHGALWWPQCTDRDCTLNFESFDAPGTSPITGTDPNAIGRDGAIVGNYTDDVFQSHAFYATLQRTPNNPATPITLHFSDIVVPGYNHVYASFVSARGEMDGTACDLSTCVIYLRSKRGDITLPGGLPAGGSVTADAINAFGAFVGFASFQYFLYQPEGNVTLLNFGAYVINDRGLIAGSGVTGVQGDANSELTLRAPNGTQTGFPAPGATNVYVLGLNNRGWIIGQYQEDTEPLHGFVWRP